MIIIIDINLTLFGEKYSSIPSLCVIINDNYYYYNMDRRHKVHITMNRFSWTHSSSSRPELESMYREMPNVAFTAYSTTYRFHFPNSAYRSNSTWFTSSSFTFVTSSDPREIICVFALGW